jgi:hypothetical protein
MGTVKSIVDRIAADVARQYPNRETSVSAIAACHPDIIAAYASKTRVKVTNQRYGDTRTGIVSRTLGWRPTLLLMHRSSDHGSSDLLNPDDVVVGWWNGRKYVPGPGAL